MPHTPAGFESQKYPLRHRLHYSFGLSVASSTMNSTILSFVRNYKDVTNDPTTIVVNPHNSAFEVETGAICGPMSIIDKLKMTLRFSLTKDWLNNTGYDMKFRWTPIFCSFPEKLDAADDMSTSTVAEILDLTKDATKEDITPTFTDDLDVTPPSEQAHPMSTANFTEVFGTMNLTADTVMESVAHDATEFSNAIRYYTNKGALKSCLGRTRHVNLSPNHTSQTFHINKFVPKPVRRIVPYTFFGILIHLPLQSNIDQHFASSAHAASSSDLGIHCHVTYDEWNPDHIQDMT